jgi:basic membrane lipoprotein Med (substrate-binding protein (PBP1-ABC) superfamily)
MTLNLNRRKFLAYGSAAFGTSLLLKACASPSTTNNPAASPTPGAGPVTGKLKVASVYTVPVEQQWVSRIHKALNEAKDRGEIEYVFSENVTNTDYERVLRQYAESGNQLLVGEAFAVEKACRAVAKDYPKVAFLMGSSGKPDGTNFSVFDNYIHEASYLTGLVAGGLTKSKVIGMVGGYPIPEVNRLMHAFIEGVKEVSPDAKFLVSFIGSWFDPPKAKEAAFAQIGAGADVMYAERFGVSDAAKEKKVPTIDRAIKAVKEGSFKAEDYGIFSFMKYGGCSVAPFGTFENKVPEKIKSLVKQRQDEILSGKLVVKINDTEPKSTV